MTTSNQLEKLCDTMHVERETVMNLWDVICTQQDINDAEPSTIEHFNMIRSELTKRSQKSASSTRIKVKNAPQLKRQQQAQIKRVDASPATPLKASSSFNKPSTPFTPKTVVSNSPLPITPFASRTNKLSLVNSMNQHIPFVSSSGAMPKFSLLYEMVPSRYGLFRIDADELNERIEQFERVLNEQDFENSADKHELENSADKPLLNSVQQDGDVNMQVQADTNEDQSTLVGMICPESLEVMKLNPHSVMLQTSRNQNLRIKLNLENADSFALFPGQIVKVTGTNMGDMFKVNQVTMPMIQPFAASSVKELLASELKPLQYMIAAGPYTLTDSLLFEPLEELVQYVISKSPNVVFLMGPFISEDHPLIESGLVDLAPSDLFQQMISPLLNRLVDSGIQVVVVPSTLDLISDTPCLPQPPFDKRNLGLNDNILIVSNPAQCLLNNISFSVISDEVLMPLSSVETTHNMTQDRLSRLVQHILSQRTFTPMFPFKFKSFSAALDFIVTPDILILPSLLKPFVKVVDGCVVINPGTTCKSASSGTFVHGIVHPFDSQELQNIKQETLLGLVDQRMRVDIMKL